MNIIIDAREYQGEPIVSGVRRGGSSEDLVRHIATALAQDHRVDVISNEPAETFSEGAYWWTEKKYPTTCDVLVACERLTHLHEFTAKRVVVPSNKPTPALAGREQYVSAYACLSRPHVDALTELNAGVKQSLCRVIEPGVTIPQQRQKIRNRIIYCNSPVRGLVHYMDAWPRIRAKIPDATLALTYDLLGHAERFRWQHSMMGEEMLRILRWVESGPAGVENMGALSPDAAIEQQAISDLYAYPCDGWFYKEHFTCLAAMEAAAARCAVLLSATDGFGEVFADVADFIPYPVSSADLADAVEVILKDRSALAKRQQKALTWAKERPWKKHHQAWRKLVRDLF